MDTTNPSGKWEKIGLSSIGIQEHAENKWLNENKLISKCRQVNPNPCIITHPWPILWFILFYYRMPERKKRKKFFSLSFEWHVPSIAVSTDYLNSLSPFIPIITPGKSSNQHPVFVQCRLWLLVSQHWCIYMFEWSQENVAYAFQHVLFILLGWFVS